MESGSTVIRNEERKKKYQIYVEEYVLSYLRREADSLELSEIYFYGSRQDKGRKIFVYGAGREKEITLFAQYEPLSELICRLTQAGPVFMVREPNGECGVNGFQVFYENNEAMQSYLLEWTGSASKKREVEKSGGQDMELPVLIPPVEKGKKEIPGTISLQLCLILMVLTAIVIASTDSYDKMKQLNQSAKEVFFAIENQEAEDSARDVANTEGQDEIVVERDVAAGRRQMEEDGDTDPEKTTGHESAEEPEEEPVAEAEDGLSEEDNNADTATAGDEPLKEGAESEADKETQENAAGIKDEPEEGQDKSGEEELSETGESEQGEEALSRSVTRYYEVEEGDTLYTISQKIYGDFSRVEKICEVNQITDPDKICSGQRIILP